MLNRIVVRTLTHPKPQMLTSASGRRFAVTISAGNQSK